MMEFELDLAPLVKAIEKAPDKIEDGVVEALEVIKDDWVSESRDIAPIDTSNLRRQIKGKVNKAGLNSSVETTANAVTRTRGNRRFNYAYYIHEGYMSRDGKHLLTPGTKEQFLKESVDEKKWQNYLENTVFSKLKRLGWDRG